MVLANYIKINPNFDKPSKKATIRTNRTNIKVIAKRIKPQIINPHSYNTHTKHSQPLKLPFKMFELDRIRIMVYMFDWL